MDSKSQPGQYGKHNYSSALSGGSKDEPLYRIARTAAETLAVPFAFITRDNLTLRASYCNPVIETLPDLFYCQQVINTKKPLYISDTHKDQRFPQNPPPTFRFFAGIPLFSHDYNVLGTLCLIDHKPRQLSNAKRQMLEDLAVWAENEINLPKIKKASAMARESDTRFSKVFRAAPIPIAINFLESGEFIEANDSFLKLTGYSRAELMKYSIVKLLGNSSREHLAQLKKLILDSAFYNHEVTFKNKNGELREVVLSCEAIEIDGEPSFLTMGRDITDDRLSREALRRSVATNRALFDVIPDLMLRINQDGLILNYKPSKESLLPVTLENLIGRTLVDIFEPGLASVYLSNVREALNNLETRVFEYQLLIDNSIRDFEARIVVSGENETLAILRDITERKTVERMKNEFISIVSHELRTPLTSIRGSLGLLVGGVVGELPDQAKMMLDIAHKNSERLVRLINDILDIEKIESGKSSFNMKPLEIQLLVEQALEANRGYGELYNVSFKLTKSLPGVMVYADQDRLMQVLANLISNATKFSPKDGVVEIALTSTPHSVRVDVTDHGNGIPKEFRNRIFQKFAQADSSDTRSKGGTGLGLSIAKAIVEKLGGIINFETEEDKGTTFYFVIPVWNETPVNKEQPQKNTAVLIVEDDAEIGLLLSIMLKQAGFETDIAYSALQARHLLQSKPYSAITLDVMLPDQNGLSLLHDFKSSEATMNIPVVMVSAKTKSNQDPTQNATLQIVDWIDKPIDQERLVEAVQLATNIFYGHKPSVLHVEDDADVSSVVSAILSNIAQITIAATLKQARRLLRNQVFDLVILDLDMPDGSGLSLLPYLSKAPDHKIPVVVFSVSDLEEAVVNKVDAILIKSRTSNAELIDTIKAIIRRTRFKHLEHSVK
ncbi:MAG: response regulator [Chloroflexi bacterium]|uniref:histidine kinase n=1 Tax=Candidatus Chlorohelix allophototropha TaxID=3003348 RepID=A0A8T7LY95_9CHLR|nr:response regulator [Chloroflexota bacterium]WJW66194.1 response regulator [Chloroflexota bacterium L227-S17]